MSDEKDDLTLELYRKAAGQKSYGRLLVNDQPISRKFYSVEAGLQLVEKVAKKFRFFRTNLIIVRVRIAISILPMERQAEDDQAETEAVEAEARRWIELANAAIGGSHRKNNRHLS